MSNELLDFHGINYSGNATPIIQLTENTIGIVVPKGSGGFSVWKAQNSLRGYKKGDLYFGYIFNGKACTIHLPKGEWELPGLADQLSEEQWKGVVEVIEGDEGFYHNYDLTTFREVYATESGHSLLRKHNLEKETTVLLKRKP